MRIYMYFTGVSDASIYKDKYFLTYKPESENGNAKYAYKTSFEFDTKSNNYYGKTTVIVKMEDGLKFDLSSAKIQKIQPDEYNAGTASIQEVGNGELEITINTDEYHTISKIFIEGVGIVESLGTVSVEYDLTNCTCSPNTSTIPGSSNTEFTVTADAGYKFKDTDKPEFVKNFITDIFAIKVSDTEWKTGKFRTQNKDQITIHAKAYGGTPDKFKGTNLLSNARIDSPIIPADGLTRGEYDFNVKSNEGYSFKGGKTPYIETTAKTTALNRVTDTEYTGKVLIDSDFSVNGDAIAETPPLPTEIPITQNLDNCQSSYSETSLTIGNEYTITVTANENYSFLSIPTYKDTSGIIKDMTRISDTQYQCTFTASSEMGTQIINASAIFSVSDGNGFTKSYNPTEMQLKAISSQRFKVITGSSLETFDYGQYIISLIQIPFKPNAISTEAVKLGSLETNVECNRISDAPITFRCGEFTFPIDPTLNLTLYLPYIGNVTLDPQIYKGKTITLEYRIDVSTGNVIAEIQNDNSVLETFTGNCSRDIPIRVNVNEIVGSQSDSTVYMMDKTPKAIISPAFSFEDIVIDNATAEELNLIHEALNNGIV